MVADFANRKWHGRGRHVVKMQGQELCLPYAYTKARWEAASQIERRWVFNACTSFKDYLLTVYSPFKAELEGEKPLDELPEFMEEFAALIQSRTPPSLLPFDHVLYEADEPWRICQVMPTGVWKSSLGEAYDSWLQMVNNDVHVLLVLSTKELGERFVRFHLANMERNELFRHIAGDLNPPNTRESRIVRADAYIIERPLNNSYMTFALLGYSGSAEGLRAEVARIDDMADFNNTRSAEALENQWKWIANVLEKRLHPHHRLLWLQGTRQERGDIYERAAQEAKNTQTWTYREEPMISDEEISAGHWPPTRVDPTMPFSKSNMVIHPQLRTLWPGFWTPQKVAEDWIGNPEAFARKRQNQLTDPHGGALQPDEVASDLWDGTFDELTGMTKPCLPLWNYLEGGAPAAGTRARALYEAEGIVVTEGVIVGDLAATEPKPGTDPDWTCFQLWSRLEATGRHILLDQVRFRTSNPDVVCEELVRFVMPYRSLVNIVALEANAVDQLFTKVCSNHLLKHVGIPVTALTLKSEKGELVSAFFRLLRARQIIIPFDADRHTVREMTPLRDELLAYRPGGKQHDDTVITGAQHLKFLGVEAGIISAWVTGSREAERRGQEGAGTLAEGVVEALPIPEHQSVHEAMTFGAEALADEGSSMSAHTRDDLRALREVERKRVRSKSDPLRDFVNSQR
jgi:hypothetical protein